MPPNLGATTIAVCSRCGGFVLLQFPPPTRDVLWFRCPVCKRRVEALHFRRSGSPIRLVNEVTP